MILTTIAYKLCLLIVAIQMVLCWATVYGLNTSECDGDPSRGAFGKMGKYPREFAITKDFQQELGLSPGDKVLILADDVRFSGTWWLNDRMPGKGRRIDLNVEGSNWSGKALLIIYKHGKI